MNILLVVYLIVGGSFAGYCLGTIDKHPSSPVVLLSMYLIYVIAWPYFFIRVFLQAMRSMEKRGKK